jgi:GNAT superfamily N-acetyltransferase
MSATEPPALVLRDAQLDGPEGLALVEELQQEYVQRYGGQDDAPIDPREFAPPKGAFLVAELDGVLVGCAGLRQFGRDVAELKRLFVRTPYRRRGLARVLLATAENRALELGYRQLILETGSKQPEAVALYQAQGYQPHENIGHYKDSDLAQMFIRDLHGDGL